jgi:hypothetical protein
MAMPWSRKLPMASTVQTCSVRECTHNASNECHAGSIEVEMRDGAAICGTYQPGPRIHK